MICVIFKRTFHEISNKSIFRSFMSMNTHLTFTALSEEAIKQIIENTIQSSLNQPTKDLDEQTLFITRQETIKTLGITLPTLRSWTVAGKLPCYRIQSRVRYRGSEVIAFIESRRIKP